MKHPYPLRYSIPAVLLLLGLLLAGVAAVHDLHGSLRLNGGKSDGPKGRPLGEALRRAPRAAARPSSWWKMKRRCARCW
jgi:hypothetical protein